MKTAVCAMPFVLSSVAVGMMGLGAQSVAAALGFFCTGWLVRDLLDSLVPCQPRQERPPEGPQ